MFIRLSVLKGYLLMTQIIKNCSMSEPQNYANNTKTFVSFFLFCSWLVYAKYWSVERCYGIIRISTLLLTIIIFGHHLPSFCVWDFLHSWCVGSDGTQLQRRNEAIYCWWVHWKNILVFDKLWNETNKFSFLNYFQFNLLLVGLVVMQGFTCIWSFKLRSSLMPRSISFEAEIDDSFEEFLKKHFKVEFSHSWNRIQEQVKYIPSDRHSTEFEMNLKFRFFYPSTVSVLWNRWSHWL